ncbi:hypothetical protein ELE36_18995 [Pseudolysobacter antarcticus]|uniref:Uncharacterized protein n=1 Tax=Pseudolysobacter antarcticus TaxID=2511995 RepID=A0A411HQJ8_9GAMM|nr:hypothetical protein ELE36_18995 [Pseudolysobacter antarcticus]
MDQQVEVAAQVAEAQAQEAWRGNMARIEAPGEGCFQSSYPSIAWTEVACQRVVPRVAPRPPKSAVDAGSSTSALSTDSGAGQTTGNGVDYVIQSAGLIKSTVGTFPTVTGVTSEKGVGVAAFGGGGILGANEYTLQINSNYTGTTSTCAGHSGCTVWQQFIYSPDYSTKGTAFVFMQYWLIGYGGTKCPSGWMSAGGGDCYRNSAGVNAPDEPITQLASLKLSGSATSGGNDTVTFTHGTTAYTISASDNVVKLASVWKQSEFNIVGNAGGSKAQFNTGSSVTVHVAITDGTSNKPTCVANAGSTGETNNLNLGSCTASAGSTPSIQFVESN